MKKIYISVFFILIFVLFSGFNKQISNPKLSMNLNKVLNNIPGNNSYLVWIFFTDKGGNTIDDAIRNLTKENFERRSKSGELNIDYTDIPVNKNYIDAIKNEKINVKQISKWFNAVSCYATQEQIESLLEYDFIRKIDFVNTFPLPEKQKNKKTLIDNAIEEITADNPPSQHSLNYGSSFQQSELINVPICHDSGYKGQGILIASFDTGVDNLTHPCFDSMRVRGIRTYDFVNHDTIISNQGGQMGDGGHGTRTLSLVAGYAPGFLISPAFQSRYIIAKTENTDSETPQEEDNWIAAAEWADSLGADIITSSLGYLDMDPGSAYTYNWTWMNGDSCRITIAADLAVHKGIIVVNSAGNNGFDANHNTLNAPADGDSVLTIGSINFNGQRSAFSSIGPTTDGRIKPDVMAVGSGNLTATTGAGTTGYTSSGSGTSFSCPMVAGACAIILSANNDLMPMQVMGFLKTTANNTSTPNNLIGWGTIDTWEALKLAREVSNIDPETPIPHDYILNQNYPNPFNPVTTIPFSLRTGGNVTIKVYDIKGAFVGYVLNNKSYPDGGFTVELNTNDFALSSGVFFYTMSVNDKFVSTRKMVLVK
ncbi:MAG TPA: S8 family serine peptidase [Ignavibacteria bacterium]|nr:S8 family serine peptidase [Ignavibacteria bacterium]